jgi:carboxyl-terminal processing protease
MRKSILALAVLVLLMPAAALPQDTGDTGGKSGVYEQLNLFGEAFERIRHDAVDPVADQKLVQTAIAGMLNSLDPRQVYLSEKEYQALQTPAAEQSASTGLVVTLDNGQVKVVAPRAESPAAAAGIDPGDFIYTIDKEPTYDMTLPEIEQKLQGPAASAVALKLRRGSGKPFDVEVKRVSGGFPTLSAKLESGDIGYVRLSGFDDKTAAELSAAVKNLRTEAGSKMIGLILDLRNNPGGSFDAAVAAADDFIDKGDITVVKGRKPEETKRMAATPGDIANGLPIVALVNGGTAREAELVAGALQDSHRAVLLGSKTFGESAIETMIPLNGNGAIRLTTARYVTPSGRAIQGKGLEPDLAVSPLKLEKLTTPDQRREADLRGALKNPDSKPADKTGAAPGAPANGAAKPDSSTNTIAKPPNGEQPSVASGDIGTTSDEQLSEAIDVLRGLAVASGRTASAAH